MIKKITCTILLALAGKVMYAQTAPVNKNFPDSVNISVHPSYNKVKGVHRWLFGENYRKEWADTVRLPLINTAKVYGGLKPEQFGGGMETKSVRLSDINGKEWVVRSVEKIPDKLLPAELQGTFAVDWVDDEYSGQHPYSALIVPPLAEAANVPHANPVIGVLVADNRLTTFSKQFAGRVVLLEEREPTGESDNTPKMMKRLKEDHNVRIDGSEFLRARLLDLLIGDWDRHEDQWRWTSYKADKDRIYSAVPRDRDQVFHVMQGALPTIATASWLDPVLGNFEGNIPRIKYSLFKTRFLQAYPGGQLNHDDYMRIVNQFVKDENDEVLLSAVKRLPGNFGKRDSLFLAILKNRRDHIPAAMEEYYRFIYQTVDIRLSDKDELIGITGTSDAAMHIVVNKLKDNGKAGDVLMDMTYHRDITKEIRLYTSAGNDHVVIDNKTSAIKLRIIDSVGNKTIDMRQSETKVKLYALKGNTTLIGDSGRILMHQSADTSAARFQPVNPYNVWMPMLNAAVNRDDGFLLGVGFRYTGKDGFRKLPYSTMQELMLTHSFATNAFRIDYLGQWTQAVGKADFTLKTMVDAPDNTMNFFGQGNQTALDKTGDYHRFYRARFDLVQLDPALRWHTGKGSTFSFGPSIQYYHLNMDDNNSRSVMKPGLITSYDSISYGKDKAHAGLIAAFISNRRDNNVLPTKGYYLDIKMQAYTGLNSSSRSFAQLIPEFTFYQKVDSAAIFVLSDRIGGGLSIGNPAFYQSLFLGGQGNLLGYLQNRFAGQQMIYNNLQARMRLASIKGYILPGQLGLTGFYDTGRVWAKGGNSSDTWHQGAGGGLYFAPASLTVLQILAGHSKEGWYPYISLNFRI
jgi:hypothetical protein